MNLIIAFESMYKVRFKATSGHCFWFNSRRFCAPPFCSKTVKDHADTCRAPCFPGPAKQQSLLLSVCRNETKATAAKIIRIPNIQPILDLFDRNRHQVNGKVIVLVRDPRNRLQKVQRTNHFIQKPFKKRFAIELKSNSFKSSEDRYDGRTLA